MSSDAPTTNRVRDAFVRTLSVNPLDVVTRGAFADYLDECGDVEAANRQRAWGPAFEFLTPYVELNRRQVERRNGLPPLEVFPENVLTQVHAWHDQIKVHDRWSTVGWVDFPPKELEESEAIAVKFFRAVETVVGLPLPSWVFAVNENTGVTGCCDMFECCR